MMVKVWSNQTCNFTFWGTSENELAALNQGESESCHSSHNSLFCETVNWFRSAELISGDSAFAETKEGILVQRRNGEKDFLNVALAWKDGNRSWPHKTVLA